MKKLLALCLALCFALLLIPAPSPGQTPGTRVRVEVDVPPPPVRTVYAAAPAPPVIAYPAAGNCISRSAGAGCSGFVPANAGGSCHGRTAGGCTGYVRAGGCQGGGPAGYAGYAAPMPAYAPLPVYGAAEVPVYAAPVGRAAPALYAGPRDLYAAGNVTYGASLSNGTYATPTGKPPGPGVLGVPGAGFPFDGPIRRTLRGAAGYDPGPAKGTVRAGWVP